MNDNDVEQIDRSINRFWILYRIFIWEYHLFCIRIVWEVSALSTIAAEGLELRASATLLLVSQMDWLPVVCQRSLKQAHGLNTTLMMAFGPIRTQSERKIPDECMPEDDSNSNCDTDMVHSKQFRWGPNHEGAKQLAQLYTNGQLLLWHLSHCWYENLLNAWLTTLTELYVNQ